MDLSKLTIDDLALLSIIPGEPTGLSLGEMAQAMTAMRDAEAKGAIRRRLNRITIALDGLHISRDVDDIGRPDVIHYAIRRETYPAVIAWFKGRKIE